MYLATRKMFASYLVAACLFRPVTSFQVYPFLSTHNGQYNITEILAFLTEQGPVCCAGKIRLICIML